MPLDEGQIRVAEVDDGFDRVDVGQVVLDAAARRPGPCRSCGRKSSGSIFVSRRYRPGVQTIASTAETDRHPPAVPQQPVPQPRESDAAVGRFA